MTEVSDVASTSAQDNSASNQIETSLIWQGVLEWTNLTESTSRQVTCQVYAGLENGEAEVKADTWPLQLIMQPMPKKLITGTYSENGKWIVFHFDPGEAQQPLFRMLTSNFVGIIPFPGQSGPEQVCEVKMLVLLYSPSRRRYCGLIPDDQATFIDHLRKVIQHQKTLRTTNPQSQPWEWVPSPGSLLGQLVSSEGQPQDTNADAGQAGPSGQAVANQDNQIMMQDTQSLRWGDEQLSQLTDTLKCPVCWMFLDRKVVQCVNGHYICQGCKRGSENCPICRKSFSNVIQNTVVQQLLERFPHRCRYDECSYFVGSNDDHELFCLWRLTDCKICTWSGCVNQLEDHVGKDHAVLMRVLERVDICRKINFDVVAKGLFDRRLLSVFGHLLWMISVHVSKHTVESVNFYFYFLATGNPCDLWVKMTLGSENHEIYFIRKISLCDLKKNCITIPAAIFKDYLKQNTLTYQFSVSKSKFTVS